ncbi:cupin domain-containing protein [Candidimonas humi]|jgi:predicted cupin superfamily sugar epimerase|uniref:Cupin domain-containing protein n=1 Tax=Candidimonas humi TaxID=683355 RepID=A0ABV8NV67_9BURK|nr:cupin domain-containing protein [Candidimonas humi]MBV6303427.1 cupin domain-containing protein [Candidimonas humi]
MNDIAAELIRRLGLQPHPEGGHYRETYRSAQQVLRTAAGPARSAGTAIYYLLHAGAYSAWHRIASDEIWHFHAGCDLHVHVLRAGAGLASHRLGDALRDPAASYQVVVPAGSWFAAELLEPQGYALVGCTVAPGFEFSEFELAEVAALLADHPDHADLIRRLAPQH